MSYLVLVRHGLSEYNKKGLWVGWHDPNLTSEGENDAKVVAEALKNIRFDTAFTSPLIRHKKTLDIVLQTLNQNTPEIIADELKERNYGVFTARNKWEVKKELGEEEFIKIRRSWNHPIKNGESLKQVYERVVPYYKQEILPLLKTDKNVIVSSSGNALRSLVKYLENISDDNITKLEIAHGEAYVYTLDENGKIKDKQIRNQHENKF